MRGLWKYLVPFSPDTSGFASVISGTDGFALFDDIRGCGGNYRMTEEVRFPDFDRVGVSEIANEDVISGTAPKILRLFHEMREELGEDPAFVMLCSCPVSSLIGTDLRAAAAQITRETGVPASSVNFSGYETYDIGIRRTLTEMAKLLCVKPEKKKESVNILGVNYLDWAEEDADGIREYFEHAGITVQSVWGGNETAARFRASAEAALNIVVSAAGIEPAKWMKKQYSIPYITGAPFGKTSATKMTESVPLGETPVWSRNDGSPQVLIIGEQFLSCAMRESLLNDYGFHSVQIAGFFTMEKSMMQPGDRKLKEENELLQLLQTTEAQVVIADPMMDIFRDSSKLWIPLPHLPVSTKMSGFKRPPLLGEQADRWLRSELGRMEKYSKSETRTAEKISGTCENTDEEEKV